LLFISIVLKGSHLTIAVGKEQNKTKYINALLLHLNYYCFVFTIISSFGTSCL